MNEFFSILIIINQKHYKRKKIKKIYELKDGKGKLKEYKYGKLIFEGEYISGERNGYGKEYNLYGILIYEGELFKWKKGWKG